MPVAAVLPRFSANGVVSDTRFGSSLPVCAAFIHVLGIACRVLDERQ
jgi:hypothetical protein